MLIADRMRRALLGLVGARMAVLSGDDPSCLASLQLGCAGVISVAANIVPAPMSQLCAAVRAGDLESARRIHEQLQPCLINWPSKPTRFL